MLREMRSQLRLQYQRCTGLYRIEPISRRIPVGFGVCFGAVACFLCQHACLNELSQIFLMHRPHTARLEYGELGCIEPGHQDQSLGAHGSVHKRSLSALLPSFRLVEFSVSMAQQTTMPWVLERCCNKLFLLRATYHVSLTVVTFECTEW